MLQRIRQVVALLMTGLLVSATSPGTYGRVDKVPINEAVKQSYLELFDFARDQQYSSSEIQAERDALKRGEDFCLSNFKKKATQYGKDIEKAQKELKDKGAKLSEAERHDLHCKIQNLRAEQSQTDLLVQNAIPVAYDNRRAKLDLIGQWPATYRDISRQLEDGSYRNRRWGDVQDIGFREIEKDQKDDIKEGQDALREMKTTGLLPKEIEDKAVVEYVRSIGQKLAARSDLKVPLNITVLDSKEINAFALPGGFLFIERGLLEKADDESELAGVIAHEMSHVVARHGHKLMTRSTIAGIFFQAAQIAAAIMTGGIATMAGYYAFQYGFYGLGMVLDLRLLGVSRDYELQADQLGIQYAWNAGYDPTGFIRFFDKMATSQGYVEGASWFRDHPPFYERMVEAEREITFLAKKKDAVVQTSEFDKMKQSLVQVTAKAADEEKGRPRLLAPEAGCPAPSNVEYKAGQPIETICGSVNTKPVTH